MKKLLLFVALIVAFVATRAQSGAEEFYSISVYDTTWLNGEPFVINQGTSTDGQGIVRIGGVYTNGAVGSGATAVDSVTIGGNGDLDYWISGSIAGTVNLSDVYLKLADTTKYYTKTQVDSIVNSGTQSHFEIILPIAGSLTQSALASTHPPGWTVTASGSDLIVTHNLDRQQVSTNVSYNTTGNFFRQYRNFADAYSGILYDNNSIRIESINSDWDQYNLKVLIVLK